MPSSPTRASRQGSPEVNSPAEARATPSRRGGTKLQAGTQAASKHSPVRVEVGRARCSWAKTAVRGLDPGAPRNPSGVAELACSEGRSGAWGGPNVPVGEVDSPGSAPWYKETPKSRAGTKGVGADHSTACTVGTVQPGGRKGSVLR